MRTLASRPFRARAGRWVAAVIVLVLGTTGLTLASGSPASAHTTLFKTSPEPGQTVGGTLDFVDMAFADVVSQARILVTHNGIEVPGTTVNDSGVVIHFTFAQPLTESGRYDVTYSGLASDGHDATEAYTFIYQPNAPPAFHIGQPGGPPARPGVAGRSWLRVGAFAVLVVAVAGLALMFLLQVQNRRSAAAADGPSDTSRGGPPGPRPGAGGARPPASRSRPR